MSRELYPIANTFEINTQGSHRKAFRVFTDTTAKLEAEIADPDIAVMYNEFQAVSKVYQTIYSQSKQTGFTYHGKTANLEQVLTAELPIELRKWEAKIRYHFYEDSPTEQEIFYNKRSPFLSGTYEDRITAISALSEKTKEFDVLADVQLQIESFYNLAQSARLVQQQNEGMVGKLSDLLENQRVLVCDVLYGVLGLLMHKYRHNRHQILRYFDWSLLRSYSNSSSNDEDNTDEEIDTTDMS